MLWPSEEAARIAAPARPQGGMVKKNRGPQMGSGWVPVSHEMEGVVTMPIL